MCNKNIILTLLAVFIVSTSSCGVTIKQTKSIKDQFQKNNTTYIIRNDINLFGQTISIADGCTLKFEGGRIINGTIIGNKTKIIYKGEVFNNVIIDGSWDIPVLKSSMFSQSQPDRLYNLCKLQNEEIDNKIFIEHGEYIVNTNTRRSALFFKSNVEAYVDGNICLEPQLNDEFYNGYYIISMHNAKNVKLSGSGCLTGDKGTSIIKGEFGHGICVLGCDDIQISGLKIKHVNGDGIAVSVGNKKVQIENVFIEDYYRNGISLVECEYFKWRNSTVRDGGGMSPYAAIDVEPNPGCIVKNAFIENISIENCATGLAGYVNRKASNTIAENVRFKNVSIKGAKIEPVAISGISKLVLDSVSITDTPKDAKYLMRILACDEVILANMSVANEYRELQYPLYLNNKKLTISYSKFFSPSLFSFHLSNATINNTQFKYESFLQTSSLRHSSNITIENCLLEGPFEIYPQNVKILKNKFYLPEKSKVSFRRSLKNSLKHQSIRFEDNVIIIKDGDNKAISFDRGLDIDEHGNRVRKINQ